MTVEFASAAYVQDEARPVLPPPPSQRGAVAWLRGNLFSSPFNGALTLFTLYLAYVTLPGLAGFLVFDAVWTGSDRKACIAADGQATGACWPFIWAKLGYFIYGAYPIDERWRANLFFAGGLAGIVWMLWLDAPRRALGAIYFFLLFPVAAFVLLAGWPAIGLKTVETSLWGGILVTLIVSLVGIVVSVPLGILLALGRRSSLPVVRFASIAFIEFVRGVPLISLLFMANAMLPLFLSGSMHPDRLLRPLVAVALFASAYMAEVIRGGLQAIPKGQYEGAMSLGLGYWQTMYFIVLPQAMRLVIPGIVNTFIGLFKDTTLVSIVGIFDLLKTVEASVSDPAWSTPVTRYTGYAFAALFYFACCFGMSRYSQSIERRIANGQQR